VSESDEVIEGPIETVLLLARLEQAGSLGTCVACRRACVWRHPEYGFMHPRCCPRALLLLEVDVWAPTPVAAPVRERQRPRRGAYARHNVA
jgi:hypothetical protein